MPFSAHRSSASRSSIIRLICALVGERNDILTLHSSAGSAGILSHGHLRPVPAVCPLLAVPYLTQMGHSGLVVGVFHRRFSMAPISSVSGTDEDRRRSRRPPHRRGAFQQSWP